jgi:5-methylcytosine-specific restriction enzyme B
MLNYKLFKNVTKVGQNNEPIGLKISELPQSEFQNEMKKFRKEFNSFVQNILPDGWEQYGVDNNWQNSGYYKAYFWNKIRKTGEDSIDDVAFWIAIHADGIRVQFGTTDKQENKEQTNKEIFEFCNDLQFEKFRRTNQWGYTNFIYLGENIENDIQYFKDAIAKIGDRYQQYLQGLPRSPLPVQPRPLPKLNTKNIILYGPPGVGKTHNHKKIVSLIEGNDFTQKEIFDFVINNKDDEIEEGSIDTLFETVKAEERVAFITFHQSFSYEDFIEGFRPNEEGKIELEDGVFKRMTTKARKNLLAASKSKKELSKEQTITEQLSDFLNRALETEQAFTKTQKGSFSIINLDDEKIKVYAPDSKYNENEILLSIDDLLKVVSSEHELNSSKEMAQKIFGKQNQRQIDTYYFNLYKEFIKIKPQLSNVIERDIENREKNHYIIIDEINRGNISKIFGELITLIEEDKRDELHVTLPYSKASFSVPSNLYIIATMNSTDKSIALIDIALRRRFTFLKMKPDSSLVKEEAKDVFESLNAFIVNKLGADFQIGHSYFMNYDDLGFVLEYKIKPLLEEYFFADPNKLEEAIKLLHLEQS